MGESVFVEWGVQYEGGVHIADDEEHARDWQKYLPQPNWIARRTITYSGWERVS